MSAFEIIVFILIVGVGQLYFAFKRRKYTKQIQKDRKDMQNAAKKLHQIGIN